MSRQTIAIFMVCMIFGNIAVTIAHESSQKDEEIVQLIRYLRDITAANEQHKSRWAQEIQQDDAFISGLLPALSSLVSGLGNGLASVLKPGENGGYDINLTALINNLAGGLTERVKDANPNIGNAVGNLLATLSRELMPGLIRLLQGVLAKTPLHFVTIRKDQLQDPLDTLAEMENIVNVRVAEFLAFVESQQQTQE
eukprot:gene8677-10189_t